MSRFTNKCKGQSFRVPGRADLYREMVGSGYLPGWVPAWTDLVPLKCGETPFETWVLNVLDFEGPFVDHPADKGGATNKGVTIATWRQMAPLLFKIPGTVATLKNMTDAQAIEIMSYYWNTADARGIQYERFQVYTAEMNWGTAAKAIPLQNALNNLGVKVKVDGIVGPVTARAINNYPDPQKLWNEWMRLIEQYWRNIPVYDPSQRVFLAGWLRRLYETRAYCEHLFPLVIKRPSKL